MPSHHFVNQSILFTVSLNGHWQLLGAGGEFCLPYIRQQHHLGRPLDLRAAINRLEEIRGAFYLWEGTHYVEYDTDQTLFTHPTRLEWSGLIRPAGPEDVSRYLLSLDPHLGPIELSHLPPSHP